MLLARRVRPFASLVLLALLAFWPLVLHPTETLYSDTNDLLAEHLPAKLFLVRSLRETGELPLWNPEQYAGSPFVHDIQVGLFYPPNLPLYFVSEPAVGPFLSWLVFAHVVLAGWLMYTYARHAGMGELAAFTAGCGYMLAPRWMMQLFLAGHTVTAGICWIPLVLLCVEKAIQGRRWAWAVGGGVAYALFVLGTHPQWTFYGSLLIGLWPLRLVTASRERERPEEGTPVAHAPGLPGTQALLVRWLVIEAVVVVVGLALCAVQLLPTFEAAGESSRSRGMAQSWSLDGAKAAMSTLIGPPGGARIGPIDWETRGSIGYIWAVVAITGAWTSRSSRVPIWITTIMIVYALGGSAIVDRLPGFSSFRIPTRILLTLAFPVAYFAGLGVQALVRERLGRVLAWASLVVAAYLMNVVTIELLADNLRGVQRGWEWWSRRVCLLYWFLVLIAWFTFLVFSRRIADDKRGWVIVGILAGDIVLMSFPCLYSETKPVDAVYPRFDTIDYLRDHNQDGHRVYDLGDLFGPGSPAASVHGIPSVRGYNPLDVARYRQFLAFIANVGEPQKAFSGDFTHPVTLSFEVKNRPLLNLLGVRYLVTTLDDPRVGAGWSRFDAMDAAPRCYNFLGPGGLCWLPRQHVYENQSVMPRAFIVPDVVPQAAEAEVLAQLKGLDIRRTGTLEGWDAVMAPLPRSSLPPGAAVIRSHAANEIVINLDGQTSGLLVLTDPWYPGWVCRIDGNEVPIWKADYAFRGVIVPEGSREVVFSFEPKSFRLGKWISLITLTGVVVLLAIAVLRRR